MGYFGRGCCSVPGQSSRQVRSSVAMGGPRFLGRVAVGWQSHSGCVIVVLPEEDWREYFVY